jgi:hypothetical protein
MRSKSSRQTVLGKFIWVYVGQLILRFVSIPSRMILREESIFVPVPTEPVVNACVLIQRCYRQHLLRERLFASLGSFLRRSRELVRRVTTIQRAYRRFCLSEGAVRFPVPQAPPSSPVSTGPGIDHVQHSTFLELCGKTTHMFDVHMKDLKGKPPVSAADSACSLSRGC